MRINPNMMNTVFSLLVRPKIAECLSLRSVEILVTQIAITSQSELALGSIPSGNQITIDGMVLMKILEPNLYRRLLNNERPIRRRTKLFWSNG